MQQSLVGINIAAESLSTLAAITAFISPPTSPIAVTVGLTAGVVAVISEVALIVSHDEFGARTDLSINIGLVVLEQAKQKTPGFGALPVKFQDMIVTGIAAAFGTAGQAKTIDEVSGQIQ